MSYSWWKSKLRNLGKISKDLRNGKATQITKTYLSNGEVDSLLETLRNDIQTLNSKKYRVFEAHLCWQYQKHGSRPTGDEAEIYYRIQQIKALLKARKKNG